MNSSWHVLIESTHSKLNSCRHEMLEDHLCQWVCLGRKKIKKLEQGLFTLFCRFAPRPGKSWDSQTSSHTSSTLAFLPSLCSQNRMSQMARQRGVVEGGRPMKQADLESAQALPLAGDPGTGTTHLWLILRADSTAVQGYMHVHECTCVCVFNDTSSALGAPPPRSLS